MVDWVALNTRDLAHVAAGYASCIVDGQLMRLADGTVLTASAIADAVKAGQWVYFGTPTGANLVTGVVRTHAKAVRIGFADGRSVALTTGHVLPLGNQWVEAEGNCGHGGTWKFPVAQQWTIRAGQVRPGMDLLDGRVEEIQDLGRRDAVRLWTEYPSWIPTADGLSIGSRWHEILHAWVEVENIFPEFEDELGGFVDYEARPSRSPMAATGWLWGTGRRRTDFFGQDLGWEPHPARDKGKFLPYPDRRGGHVHLAELGDAGVVRATIAQRWYTAPREPFLLLNSRRERAFQRRRMEGMKIPKVSAPTWTWGDNPALREALERTQPTSLGLIWSNPDQLRSLLVGGGEVVGEPTILRAA